MPPKVSTDSDTSSGGYLKKFKSSLESFYETKAFLNLDLWIADNYKAMNEQEFLNAISKKIIGLRGSVFADVKSTNGLLFKAVFKCSQSKDQGDFSKFINMMSKALNSSSQNASAEPKHTGLGLKDYFGELETLQDSLKQVKVIADNMANKNREANLKCSQSEGKSLF